MAHRPHNSWSRWLKGYHRDREARKLAQFKPAAHSALHRAALVWLGFMGASVVSLLVWIAIAIVTAQPAHAQQAEASRYKLTLRREAQQVWGIQPPVGTFAAQIHQESRWRTDARSPVGAQGLAQFMPGTTQWIGGVYGSLGERAPLNPTWSIRALVNYDKWLSDRITARDDCERMAFVLSAYNGGLGWVYKRQKLSPTPAVCLGATCTINPGITPASQRENAAYPVVILQRWEPLYEAWGPGSC